MRILLLSVLISFATYQLAILRSATTGLLFLTIASAALYAYLFLNTNKSRLLSFNLFILASLTFLSLPGFYYIIFLPQLISYEFTTALNWAFLGTTTTYLTYNIFLIQSLRRRQRQRQQKLKPQPYEPQVNINLLVLSIGLTVAGILLYIAWPRLSVIPRSLNVIGLTGVALFAAYRANGSPLRLSPFYAVLLITGIVSHIFIFFGGSGRLQVATVALAVTLPFLLIRPRRIYKYGLLLLLVPALFLGSADRAGYDYEEVTSEAAGAGSIVGPAGLFADLYEKDKLNYDPFPRQYGRTFYETSVYWVPRAIWPEKPVGFGFRLTLHINPGLARTGHSYAALGVGEWYINFGLLGILLFGLTSGIALAFIDSHLTWIRLSGDWDFFCSLIFINMAVGIADYVWVGSFTYAARTISKALLIIFIFSVYYVLKRLFQPQYKRVRAGSAFRTRSTLR